MAIVHRAHVHNGTPGEAVRNRIVYSIVATAALSVGLAGSAAAGGGGGGGYLPPGIYRTTAATAFAQFNGADGSSSFLSVSRGTHHFILRRGSTLPSDYPVVDGTMVNLQVWSPAGPSGNGCWIVPSADFIQASGLTGAALHTTVPALSNCPGLPVTVGSGSAPQGGGGGGGGFATPLTIAVDWTSLGAVTTSRGNFATTCLKASVASQFVSDAVAATAAGSIFPLSSGMTSEYGSIGTDSSTLRVTGVASPSCLFY